MKQRVERLKIARSCTHKELKQGEIMMCTYEGLLRPVDGDGVLSLGFVAPEPGHIAPRGFHNTNDTNNTKARGKTQRRDNGSSDEKGKRFRRCITAPFHATDHRSSPKSQEIIFTWSLYQFMKCGSPCKPRSLARNSWENFELSRTALFRR